MGVTFLNETFSDRNAPVRFHTHEGAAQAILKALLPDQGTDIKGAMKSKHVLLQASGYARRPNDFDELLDILNSELRLITPTPPPGSEAEEETQAASPEREQYYQLTHDYLVPAVREWLVLKQKETRRGRAELRLAELSSLWNSKPENRRLPSLLEWTNIGLLTKKKDWTEPQRKLMRRAGRVHGVRGVLTFALLTAGVLAGIAVRRQFIESQQATHAEGLVQRLLDADTPQVPEIVGAMRDYRRWVDSSLRSELEKGSDGSRQKLHASLALLPVDATQVDYLFNRLIKIKDKPSELRVLRDALQTQRSTLTPKLWTVLESVKPGDASLLPAASALANYDPDDARWEAVGGKVAQALVSVNSISLGDWLKYLTDVRSKLNPPLATIFRGRNLSESERTQVTNILADYASDDPDLLADLLLDSEEKPFAILFDRLKAHQERTLPLLEAEVAKKASSEAKDAEKDHLAQRKAHAAVALMRLGQGEKVWLLLRHSPDPSVRSYIVNWLKPLGAEPKALMTRLKDLAHDPVSIPKDGKSRMDAILFHPETSERRALILALGRYNLDELSPDKREPLVEHLRKMYCNDPDAGIHGAAEWTLRRWKQGEKLAAIDAELKKLKDRGNRRWYVNSEGQTFVVIEGPVEFMMGSPITDQDRELDETLHRQRINHRYAIASKEVTVEQYQRFLKENPKIARLEIDRYSPEPTGPRDGTTWYQAAAYCNWLSQQEGLATCYEPNDEGEYAEGMKIRADALQRTGYRLPTEAEWEYACRAGAVTSRHYGRSVELLGKYAWYLKNSQDRTWPCGQLLPNELGLFDMLGNVYEWCQDQYYGYLERDGNMSIHDINIVLYINTQNFRLLRGGSFIQPPAYVRSAYRFSDAPSIRYSSVGFRPLRPDPLVLQPHQPLPP